jgi:hypothetical protein
MTRLSIFALLLVLPATGMCHLAPVPQSADDEQLRADVKLFADAKIPHDDAELLDLFKKRMPSKADDERVWDLAKKLASKSFKERDQARVDIEKEGPVALPQLRKLLLSNPELEVRQRAERAMRSIEAKWPNSHLMAGARILAHRRPAGALLTLIEFVAVAPDEAVEEEVHSAIYRLARVGASVSFLPPEVRGGKLDPALLPFLGDKNASRRAVAALAVASFGTAEEQKLVVRLLADDNVSVRFRAAQGLAVARDKSGLAVAIEVLKDSPLDLGLQAEDLLSIIAAEKAPEVYLGESADLRGKCHAAWKQWWAANNDTVDLAKVDVPIPFGGQAERAKKGAILFINSIVKGDLAAVKKAVDVPFTFAGAISFTTRQELDNFLDMVLKQMPPQKIEFKVAKIVPGVEYIKSAGDVERTFLENARVPQVQVVYVDVKEGPAQQLQVIPIFVRISGGRALCIGIGNPRMGL